MAEHSCALMKIMNEFESPEMTQCRLKFSSVIRDPSISFAGAITYYALVRFCTADHDPFVFARAPLIDNFGEQAYVFGRGSWQELSGLGISRTSLDENGHLICKSIPETLAYIFSLPSPSLDQRFVHIFMSDPNHFPDCDKEIVTIYGSKEMARAGIFAVYFQGINSSRMDGSYSPGSNVDVQKIKLNKLPEYKPILKLWGF
jgi:hypothetical protein